MMLILARTTVQCANLQEWKSVNTDRDLRTNPINNQRDDKLPHRSMLEVELADAAIRINRAGGLNLDVAGAIAEKMAYNANREDHKIAARQGENGKKI